MERWRNWVRSRNAWPVPGGSGERRRDLAVLLAYLLLTLVLTLPLALQFGTHVAGDGSDDPALTWNLWWVRYAILDLGRSPIYTDIMFYPIGVNLAYYTLTYLNAFVSIPFQFASGLIPAANVNLLLSFTLGGFGAYLLVKHLIRSEFRAYTTQAAFAAGLLYAFSSNKFLYASLGQFNIASSQWIPFYVLFLIKLFPIQSQIPSADQISGSRAKIRLGFLLGLFLLLQALSELTFASFLVLFSLAYYIYWLIANRSRLLGMHSGLRYSFYAVLVAGLVFLIPMLPIFAALISDMLKEGDYLQQGLGFSNSFSADLVGFFVPSHLQSFFGGLESQFHFVYINFVYLGYIALALAILALFLAPRARIWAVWFGIIFLIALGPSVRINGAEFNLPFLPFNALLKIPLVEGNRYPSRWSVMLTLCLAVLVGFGVATLLTKLASRHDREPQLSNSRPFRALLPSLLCFLLVIEHISVPLPTSDMEVPEIYSIIERDPGSFTVMELPLAWRNGFRVTGSYRADSQAPIDRGFMLAQWYQSAQQRPILNGNTSRNPELKFQYFAETPVLDSLIAIQEGHSIDDATRARDKQLAPSLLQFFNIRYVIWHTPFEEPNRDVANRSREYVQDTFPITKIAESYQNGAGVVLYRVNDMPQVWNAYMVDGKHPLARLFFGEGWGPVGENTMWVTRQEAKLFFPLTTLRDTRITISEFAPIPADAQGVTARINDHVLGHYRPIPINAGSFSLNVPASMLKTGLNELVFDFDAVLPYDRLNHPPLSIVVRSAGEEQGDFGHIYVNGVDQSPNARGYNIVAIDPLTGAIDGRENFDTFASDLESTRMGQFIDQIPNGKIVAVAVRDEASQHLTPAATEALKSLGAKLDLSGKFRWSHAFLVTKGTPQGAREAASETIVSQVFNAALITEPNIAATVGEIGIEAQQ